MEKDSLDSLFNKKFKSPSKRDMDWVSPDDSIFENVLDEILEEDRRKPVFWRNRYGFFLLLLIPIAGLFAVYGGGVADESYNLSDSNQSTQLMNLTEELASIENSNNEERGEVNTTAQQSLNESSTQRIKSNAPSAKRNILNTNTNTASLLFNNSNSQSVVGSIGSATSMRSELSTPAVLTSPTTIQSSNSINSLLVDEAKPSLSMLSLIDSKINLEQFDVALGESILPEMAELKEVPLSIDSRNSFSIAAGYISSSVSHPNGPLSNEMVMNGHDEFRSGWNIEAALNHELSPKWTLHTSLGFNNIQMESLTTCSFNYDSANESMVQGQLMYNTPLTLITPTTGFVDNVEFVIEEGAMNDDDMLMNNLDISQGISTLSLGFGISNELYAKNNFSLGVGVNVGLDYIVRIQEHMKVEIMTEDYMLFEKDKEWVNHHGLNRFGAYAGVNISGQWKLSDTHAIFVRPSYRRSLTSVRSGDILTERSYFNIYNISTGINIRF